MADASYVTSLLGGLSAETRAAWRRVWDYVLRDVAFGAADENAKAENLRGHFYTATTPSTANTEFSVAHGLGTTPNLALSVLPLNVINAQMVTVKNTRAADSARVYLSSPTTAATIYLYVE